ncbi:endopeptidase La [Caldicellulosiruptor changbaiensis]|uniref:Lon protease n=2 Tax=Caldicellulosiruptor changbaiensis TaxID=1222016 RepID=A0A3T0D7D0_9FIRM|nr:endopeptidase La [Caldicellulosiruptor changbaiensis]AZT90752.1 endopeptidase La [Caldicellulosiruptor changbaiensis]
MMIAVTKRTIPVIPLRGLVVFPYMMLHFDVGRQISLKALEEAMNSDQQVLLLAQKDPKQEEPSPQDLYQYGTVAKIKQMLKLPSETSRILVEGLSRAKVIDYVSVDPYFLVEVEEYKENGGNLDDPELEALIRNVVSAFEEYARLTSRIPPDAILSVTTIQNPGQLADVIAANVIVKLEDKQLLLEQVDLKERLTKLYELILREKEIIEIERKITLKVKKQIDKMQKEYYLREQLKAIQSELGEKDSLFSEAQEYREQVKKLGLSNENLQKVYKEIDRLEKLPPNSPEVGVIRTYLEWVIDLPWNVKSEEKIDINVVKNVLDEDHYGLTKVKERILEYIAVRKLKNNLKGPILCLVGPPGVGKTSIAKSIARALNRNYVRISLGGLRDEAEIRGHRKTYVGAMPGRIIYALRQAKTKNPLILLDEIDKMSQDFRGDPASALLEVLDSEQNYAFRDHYIEIPFDLSEVMFIATANTLETIPRPLLDRLEVIEITGYTEEEKVEIAKRYLFPKQIEQNGLKKSQIRYDEAVIRDIISFYTRESGVRNLEREIARLCRRVAKEILEENKKMVRITTKNLEKYLGVRKYRRDELIEEDRIGIVTGLAWTPFGGETLSVEALVMPGSGKLELTGQLGDVMKESAKAAVSIIRARAKELGIDENFYKEYDIHIHVPEGAIPKDGPSAGVTMATAMVSALSKKPVRHDVAMTGEITLSGRVLPIGGVKEKILAAKRVGIKNVILPYENKKDVDELEDYVKKDMNFVFVKAIDEVFKIAIKE